jgi:hypothetical protein
VGYINSIDRLYCARPLTLDYSGRLQYICAMHSSCAKMPNVSPLIEPKPACARSRVSNHRDLLPDVDGRSAQARRYRDVLAALVSDAGGLDRLSEARIQLLRRFASIAVIAETMEAGFVAGTATIEITAYSTLTSTLVRLASRIGLARSAKDVTPTLADYLAQTAEIEPAEPEDE